MRSLRLFRSRLTSASVSIAWLNLVRLRQPCCAALLSRNAPPFSPSGHAVCAAVGALRSVPLSPDVAIRKYMSCSNPPPSSSVRRTLCSRCMRRWVARNRPASCIKFHSSTLTRYVLLDTPSSDDNFCKPLPLYVPACHPGL